MERRGSPISDAEVIRTKPFKWGIRLGGRRLSMEFLGVVLAGAVVLMLETGME